MDWTLNPYLLPTVIRTGLAAPGLAGLLKHTHYWWHEALSLGAIRNIPCHLYPHKRLSTFSLVPLSIKLSGFLMSYMRFFGTKSPLSLTTPVNNQGSISSSHNMSISSRNKHTDIRFQYICEADRSTKIPRSSRTLLNSWADCRCFHQRWFPDFTSVNMTIWQHKWLVTRFWQ